MRVVLDTNVLLSASFTPGACEVLLDMCLISDDVTVVLSEHILAEFTRHAVDKFAAPADKVKSVADMLRDRCTLVAPAEVPHDAVSDADDLPVLGTAIAGQADYLVTGDMELQKLGQFHSVAVLSPRTLYERIRNA